MVWLILIALEPRHWGSEDEKDVGAALIGHMIWLY